MVAIFLCWSQLGWDCLWDIYSRRTRFKRKG